MEAVVTLPPDVRELRRARLLADQTSARPPLLDAIRVVIAELAANAVDHARTTFTVRVSEDEAGVVTVAVHDESPALPTMGPPFPAGNRGRGLLIVDHFAEEWGTTSEPDDGKTVWAVLAPG